MKDARAIPSTTTSVPNALAVVKEVKTAQDLRAIRPDLVDVVRGTLDLAVRVEVSNYLVRLLTPCTYLKEGSPVTFQKGGSTTVKEIIDDANFTVDRALVDGEDTLTAIEVKDLHVVREGALAELCLSAIREIELPNFQKMEDRLAMIEKFFGSALARLRKLENM